MELKEAIKLAKEFYGDKVPSTVTEYCKAYPKGLGRTVLRTKFGLTAGEFLKLIGSSYTTEVSTEHKVFTRLAQLGLVKTCDTHIANKNTKFRVRCRACSLDFTTYWGTLSQCKYGCKACAGNLQLSQRPEFLQQCADRVSSKVMSTPRTNSDKLVLQCSLCDSKYTITTSKITNPQSPLEGTCPNCRSTDRRCVKYGVTFGSRFELECYELLKHLNPRVQVRYADHIPTARKWVCDFVIEDAWIEVSSFRRDYKGYFANIDAKRVLVESTGLKFFYLTSIQEVKDFVDKI